MATHFLAVFRRYIGEIFFVPASRRSRVIKVNVQIVSKFYICQFVDEISFFSPEVSEFGTEPKHV